MNEMEQFQKRITELADRAYARGIVLFSDFLDLNQQNALRGIRWKEHGIHLQTFGGYSYAERQMAAFVPDALSFSPAGNSADHIMPEAKPEDVSETMPEASPGWPYPISVISAAPSAPRYSEPLTHRDYLGSILSLGIERSLIGDLIIKDHAATIFCAERMADYICEELIRVRHTEIKAVKQAPYLINISPETEEKTGSVASLRLDALIALAFGIQRSRAALLVQEGAVFVNAKLVTSNGHPPRENDLISVRKLGKCRFCGILHQTKKGRIMVRMERFV